MPKEKHIPIRTCIGCRESSEKSNLHRIVKTPEGDILLDKMGKMNGRGAYVCSKSKCLASIEKNSKLDRALKCKVPESFFREIKEIIVVAQDV